MRGHVLANAELIGTYQVVEAAKYCHVQRLTDALDGTGDRRRW